MNVALHALSGGEDAEGALGRSFRKASEGFGAEKALLLLVDEEPPLRCIQAAGVADEQIRACERGESARGLSSSVIRSAIATRAVRLIENPLAQPDLESTPALPGHDYSVLCAPLLDPLGGRPLALMYFQTSRPEPGAAYAPSDAAWLEGYAAALSQAFALYFEKQRRERALHELLGGQVPEDGPEIIGSSSFAQRLRRELHEVYIPAADAPQPDPVLVLGERGTGKDLVARYLHAYSARRRHAFVAVNCAEIADELASARLFGHRKGAFTGAVTSEPGFFRAAHGGVLLLDEVADLSPRAQGTLLRVLENHTVVPLGETREVAVDVQVVLATNRDLDQAVAAGALRADLLDRFRTQTLRLVPLRERPWDVAPLAQHFLAHHERRMRKRTLGPTDDFLRALAGHAWPGNVRELARVCSLLVSHARPGSRLDRELLERCYPDVARRRPAADAGAVPAEATLREAVRGFQRELILSRLERHDQGTRAARESLGLAKTTFHRYLAALGITLATSGDE
jgi:DNA-binding NtrC family response regulator